MRRILSEDALVMRITSLRRWSIDNKVTAAGDDDFSPGITVGAATTRCIMPGVNEPNLVATSTPHHSPD